MVTMTPTPRDRALAARSGIQRMKTVVTLVDGVVDHPAARTVAAGLGEVVRAAERAEVAAVAHAEGT